MKTISVIIYTCFCLMGCVNRPPVTVSGTVPELLSFDSESDIQMVDQNEVILDLDAPNWTIYFGFNSFSLREAYKAAALGEYMKTTGVKVILSGFASEEGTDEYNLVLGARRAQAVRDYLEAYGVPVERIAWESFGEENPVTMDPAKMEMNRRVEIKIEGVSK